MSSTPSLDTEQTVFAIDHKYGLVILAAIILLIECYLFGMFIVGSYRKRIFSKGYMMAEFGQAHQLATGQEITHGGYPDMGSGMYSQRLDYNSWLVFNKAQRIHQNFTEVLAIIVIFILIAGWEFPITAAVLGFVHAFGRLLSISYLSTKGAGHFLRIFSSLISAVTILGSFVLAFIVAVHIIKHQQQ